MTADGDVVVAVPDIVLGHYNNLLQKKARARTPEQRESVARAFAAYLEYKDVADKEFTSGRPDWVHHAVAALSEYLKLAKQLERTETLFNWRSDYAGSIIPEFLQRFTYAILRSHGVQPLTAGRDAVVELTLNGSGRGWDVRRKNQDFCLGLERVTLHGDEAAETFMVPLVVAEIKTNLDINKLSGLNFSAESLKRSFPLARYFIVTETVDFSLRDNYVAGAIDEIYVLRRTMRSQHRRTPVPLQPEVFELFFRDATHVIEHAAKPRGHVYDRIDSGKLINGA